MINFVCYYRGYEEPLVTFKFWITTPIETNPNRDQGWGQMHQSFFVFKMSH